MSFPRYPRYKDSGLEWLGEVPEHWDVCRLKFLANVQTGVAKGKDNAGKETVSVPYLRVANVQDGYIDLNEVATIEMPIEDVPRYLLKPGDVLMNEGGDFDKLGRGHVWDGAIDPCIHQNHVFAVRPTLVSSSWLNRFTGSLPAQFYFMSRSKQSTNLASISSTNIMELPVVIPSENERLVIERFLDSETAKIDALIEEQQRLIELLKEKRQAMISQAVTKGLDPSVPMKAPGVEAIGRVPEHWNVVKIKNLINCFEQGWSPQCESYPVASNQEWGVLKVGCVNGGIFKPEENKSLPPELEPLPALGVRAGDLLISRANTRDLVGSAAVVVNNHENLLLCDKLYRLRFNNHSSPHFVGLYLGTSGVRGQIELAATGASSSMLNIAQSTILELSLALPDLSEQQSIVAHVSAACEQLDKLTNEASYAISLLTERRSALISAAVTGKIDVRGFVPAQPGSVAA